MENFDLAEATLEFTTGTSAEWNNFDLPIPNNVVIYTTDTQIFKKGNGSDTYAALPAGPSIAGIAAGSQDVINTLVLLTAGDEDHIIYINNETYDASTTSIADIVARMDAIEADDIQQASDLSDVSGQTVADESISGADEGKIAVAGTGKMTPGQHPDDILPPNAIGSKVHIRDIKLYTAPCCSNEVTEMEGDSTYYATVDGMHDEQDLDNLIFGLTSVSTDLTITLVERNQFKVVVGSDPAIGTVGLTGTVEYGSDTVERNVNIPVVDNRILVSVYGGSVNDTFFNNTVDSNDNIICIGRTQSEGAGSPTMYSTLVVKYDSELNILAKKTYGSTSNDYFYNTITDSNDDIICVGITSSEGPGSYSSLLVKFSSDLSTIIAKKLFSGTGSDRFYDAAVDSNGNIFCCGFTTSEGAGGYDGFVVKFDSSFNILAKKIYGGTSNDYFYSVIVDSSDNVFCAGSSTSEGAGNNDGLVVKFDNNLGKLAAKVYGGAGSDYFEAITIDSQGNIFCCSNTSSEGGLTNTALIVKFDNNLNKLAGKIYSGTSVQSKHYSAVVDSQDNIIMNGYVYNDVVHDSSVIKLDNDLNLLIAKSYAGSSDDYFLGITVDSYDNIICVGETLSEGQGGWDCILVKFPNNIPSDTFVGSILNNMVLSDIDYTLADSNLTLADSNLTLADSVSMTLTESTMVFGDSNLTQLSDILG